MKLFLLVFCLPVIITTPTIVYGCFEVEREALLTFKAGLHDPGNLMSSWHGQNCCNWSGVTCEEDINKHVVKLNLPNSDGWFHSTNALNGEINLALLSLRYLAHLDLSYNDFSNLNIPKFIGSFENLVYLNLSFCWFQGVIPYEFGNLSRLQFLDISGSEFTGIIPPQLGNLSNLQYLNLAYSYESSDVPNISSLSWLYRLSNLRYIDMSSVNLNNGVDWSSIKKMYLLKTLVLSSCDLSEIPIDMPNVNLTSLTKFDLSYNSFHGTPPNWLWNLTNILHLDLKSSGFQGNIPRALSNLVSLNYLSLGGNDFDHVLLEPIRKLRNLRTLDLSDLNIGGNIVDLIRSLGDIWYNLEEVYLGGNNLSGNISSCIAQMKNLSIIDLRSNLLSGHITDQIGTLTQLKELYLFNNSLSGVITEKHFVNLTNLSTLDLSGNYMLTLKINDKWVPPFKLRVLSLNTCKVGPPFPSWLQGQTQLTSVHLSNASITGVIPTWFWNRHLQVVDLSNNKITNLDLFENHIDDGVPNGICEMKDLEMLDLSNNAISGEIPFCWMNISSLMFMDLSNNKLTGQLPSIVLPQYLLILNLDNNKLHGEIPSTLQQCDSLLFLSLGKNNFSGKIPSWIGKKLHSLIVLQLRSNKFSGSIPPELGELVQLHILDLAHNSLVGPLPSSFGNFSSMKNNSSGLLFWNMAFDSTGSSYEVTLYIDINGQPDLTSLPLGYEIIIDISENHLVGHIPKEIWLLATMTTLNLSNNHLMGEIPETIGAMRSLESLDVSCNHLSGPIPNALSSLSSLHNLNLSYNNFSGNIPTGRQLDTLNNPSIYAGNPYLCGSPINKSCFEDQTNKGSDFAQGGNEREMEWFCLAVALGCIVGLWSVWAVLIFTNAWKVVYFQWVDRCFDKMYVLTMLAMRRFGW